MRVWRLFALVLAMVLALSACARTAGDRVVRVPKEEEAEPSSEVEPACREVTISDLGLTFEVPVDWAQLERDLAWTPKLGGELRLGLGLDIYASAPSAEALEELRLALQHVLESARWAEGTGSAVPAPRKTGVGTPAAPRR